MLPFSKMVGASLYSYGDSAGITPASLLIPPWRKPNLLQMYRQHSERKIFILVQALVQ
jgi:hypothetical protein